MPLSARQQACLAAMGIIRWQAQAGAGSPTPELTQAGVLAEGVADAVSGPDWATLESAVRQCTACELHRGRTQTVFGVGNRQASLLLVGEAPGAEEDRQGEPFVGRAGQLLNAMLAAIGLTRHEVYIANILKCRPPNNRDPKPEEAELCANFLHQQIALIQPQLIVALGRIAAQRLLKTDTPLGKLRGRLHPHPDTGTPLVVTYHPAYLLRTPLDKRKAWADLLFIKKNISS